MSCEVVGQVDGWRLDEEALESVWQWTCLPRGFVKWYLASGFPERIEVPGARQETEGRVNGFVESCRCEEGTRIQ